MFFQQVVHSDLGCASYVIANGAGEAVVVDPRWEIEPYLEIAASHGFRITRVVETHNHADHVSGHGRLVAKTGAEILVHEDAGVEYPHGALRDGDVIDLGDVRFHVLHTPGHRPEHIALAVEDVTRGSEPWLVLTGDSLFVGDVARPDLAVDGTEGARLLFESLHRKLLQLPEFAAIYPAHVAGSLCGRVSSEVFSTTLGYEKRYNEALRIDDGDGFVRYMNENLPHRPPNMERIVQENRGPLLSEQNRVEHTEPESVDRLVEQSAVLLDVRPSQEYLAGHVRDAIHVPLDGGQFGTRAGFVLPAGASIVIVARNVEEAESAAVALRVVAFDDVAGWISFSEWAAAKRTIASIPEIQPSEAFQSSRDGLVIVDVREKNEWIDGMASGAIGIPYHEIADNHGQIARAGVVAVACQSGNRSAIAISLLERAGFENLSNLAGGMDAWRRAALPMATPS